MNTGGEAAEQIVRMNLEGFEAATKITGAGARNTAILLYSILKERQKTKGRVRLTNMLRSGKELKVFTVKSGDLRKLTQETKKYGILYCILANGGSKDPNVEVDVIARTRDASKISRIMERFNLVSVDVASTVTEAKKPKGAKDKLKDVKTAGKKDAGVEDGQPGPDIGAEERVEKDRPMDALMDKPVKKEENVPDPLSAKTEESPLSEPTLRQQRGPAERAIMTKAEKPPVREELRKIREGGKEQEVDISPAKEKLFDRAKKSLAEKVEHKQPQKRKCRPKSKGERQSINIHDVFSGGSRTFDKEEWVAQKREQRREIYELTDNTCSEMVENGDSFRQYLDAQGYFGRYSVNNAILASAQMPETTQLKGYNSWKQSRVYVDEDAQKVTILEPGREHQRDGGLKTIGCSAEVVYDVSQTSARDRRQPQEQKNMYELVSAVTDASPVPLVPVDDFKLPTFYDSLQQAISIKTGLSEKQLSVSMAREVSAAVLDCKHKESRNDPDFGSFCVAYIVSSRYGMDTKGFNSDKLPREFEGMETQAFKRELGSIRDILREIQPDVYKSLEKDEPPKSKEQEC